MQQKILAGKTTQRAEYLNQFNEMNSLSGEQKHQDAASVIPFVGLTGSKLSNTDELKRSG